MLRGPEAGAPQRGRVTAGERSGLRFRRCPLPGIPVVVPRFPRLPGSAVVEPIKARSCVRAAVLRRIIYFSPVSRGNQCFVHYIERRVSKGLLVFVTDGSHRSVKAELQGEQAS